MVRGELRSEGISNFITSPFIISLGVVIKTVYYVTSPTVFVADYTNAEDILCPVFIVI